jgi:hypothetical protein
MAVVITDEYEVGNSYDFWWKVLWYILSNHSDIFLEFLRKMKHLIR